MDAFCHIEYSELERRLLFVLSGFSRAHEEKLMISQISDMIN